ncbi:MAG: succinate--CoA ligase subunit alpha [Actinomycetota bacterium]|nr:succinate--CoA ligase subunit alpha [Actinomycetota bacterium]
MILVDEYTRVVVQGLTGSQGRFHGLRNRDYGTQVVAGVTPGKGGTDVEGIPVFDTVAAARAETGADASLIFVPPAGAAGAVVEAADAGIGLIVCITEGIPFHEEVRVNSYLRRTHPDVVHVGPNCPGVISPGHANIGITPVEIALAGGPVGVVSRSGTLTYQALYELTRKGIGQTTCVGIGGDPVPGTGFVECLRRFQDDPDTRAVILIGEIGGTDEEAAAEFVAAEMTKPVVAYVAGVTAPEGRRMGHAGAIVSGSAGGARAKIEALRQAGVEVVETPTDLGERMADVVARLGPRQGGDERA